jgi:murein L,D-transpeptidase YafK
LIKLKDILIEQIGFQIPGTPKQKNIGRQTRQEFAKFFNNFEAGNTKTAISNYAEQVMASDAPDDIKKNASEVLNEMEKIAIDIQDELHTRQISDDEVAEKLFDYVNSEMDASDSIEFEQLLWYDNQIDMSLKSGMIENAVAIMDQLLRQLEFIRGFILQEFPEISPIGFKR